MFRPKFKLASLLFIAFFSAVPALAGDWAGLSAKGPLVINLENAPALFEQCSRASPKPSGKIWLPSESEVIEMEEKLVKIFDSLGDEFLSDPRWSKGAYRGQYAGYGTGSERHIYGAYVTEEAASNQAKGEVILVCDGGPAAWGILFKVATSEFFQPVANAR